MAETVTIPVALNFGNLLVMVIGAALLFVWHTTKDNIARGDKQISDSSRERDKRLEDRLAAVEASFLSLPQRMEGFGEQLKRIELLLANHYPTKEEVRTELSQRFERIAKVETAIERLILRYDDDAERPATVGRRRK